MRALLLVGLILAPAVQAQVIECPKFYPWQDTPVAEVPYQHKGKGFIAKAALAGAGMYTGEINGRGELMGDSRKVKGGFDVEHGFAAGETKWLVCSYAKGDITWWEQIDAKVTACKLEVRESGRDPASVKATCR